MSATDDNPQIQAFQLVRVVWRVSPAEHALVGFLLAVFIGAPAILVLAYVTGIIDSIGRIFSKRGADY
jgi:hypothetical protein